MVRALLLLTWVVATSCQAPRSFVVVVPSRTEDQAACGQAVSLDGRPVVTASVVALSPARTKSLLDEVPLGQVGLIVGDVLVDSVAVDGLGAFCVRLGAGDHLVQVRAEGFAPATVLLQRGALVVALMRPK